MEASSAITRTFLWVLRKMRWISVSVASGRGTRMTKVQTHLRAARPVCGWQLDADLVLAVFLAARGKLGEYRAPFAAAGAHEGLLRRAVGYQVRLQLQHQLGRSLRACRAGHFQGLTATGARGSKPLMCSWGRADWARWTGRA
jgi:hypothetical protein